MPYTPDDPYGGGQQGAYAPPDAFDPWQGQWKPGQPLVGPGADPWRYDGSQTPAQDPGAGQQWNWQAPDGPQHGAWGTTATAPTAPAGGPTGGQPTGGGAVSSVGAQQPQINVPSSTLPGEITDLFNRQPQQSPVQGAYQDALLKFMGRSQEMPSLTDSTLAPQVEVFRAQQQRNAERGRLHSAERAAAGGQSQSGYLDRLISQGEADRGFNTASFNANLLGGEVGRRSQELQSGLQLARATGDAESERELRGRLAQAAAMMQQQGLNLQGQLGGGDLSLRLMQTLLGQDNFYDQLGVNTSLNMEGLNQRALQTLLGGL